MPRFSIVTVLYNAAPYLRDYLDSIRAQTFSDWETICIDNGSTDGSGDILDEYAARDGRFRIIHQAKGGGGAACNRGLDEAKGDWIWFVDAADALRSEALGHVSQVLATCPGVEAYSFGKMALGASPPAEWEPLSSSTCQILTEHGVREFKLFVRNVWTVVFRRQPFSSLRFRGHAFDKDMLFCTELFWKVGSFALDSAALYFHRVRPESSTEQVTSVQAEGCLAMIRDWIALLGPHVRSWSRRDRALWPSKRFFLAGHGDCFARISDSDRGKLLGKWLELQAQTVALGLSFRYVGFAVALLRVFKSGRLAGRLIDYVLRADDRSPGSIAMDRLCLGMRTLWRIGCPWPLSAMRTMAVRQRLDAADSIEVVLTHQGQGGARAYVERHVSDSEPGRLFFVVRPDTLRGHLAVETFFPGKRRARFFVRSLLDLDIPVGKPCGILVNELVHWHQARGEKNVSVAGLRAVLADVLALRSRLRAKLTFLLHDYYCLCPRYSLLGPDARYCASEISFGKCGWCLADSREALLPVSKPLMPGDWREAFSRFLHECDEVRAFSEDTRRRVCACFPNLAVTLVPHRPLFDFPRKPRLNPDGIVVGVFGKIVPAKGLYEVLRLARYLEQIGRDDVRLVIVGGIDPAIGDIPGNVRVLEDYAVPEMPDIIEREGINIGFLPSVWPETFSYVTQELVALELPLVCFDLGAPRDRVRQYAKGAVIPAMTPEAAWDTIESLHRRLQGGG